MTDLLTDPYIDELRREYARTVAPLVAALGPLLDPPPPEPGVAAILSQEASPCLP